MRQSAAFNSYRLYKLRQLEELEKAMSLDRKDIDADADLSFNQPSDDWLAAWWACLDWVEEIKNRQR